MEREELVVIFWGSSWEAQLVKGALENEGIQAFIEDEEIGSLLPIGGGGKNFSVKVAVSSRERERAKALLSSLDKE